MSISAPPQHPGCSLPGSRGGLRPVRPGRAHLGITLDPSELGVRGQRRGCSQGFTHTAPGWSYRSTSLIRNTPLLGTYSRTLPRVLGWSYGGRAVSYGRGTAVLEMIHTHCPMVVLSRRASRIIRRTGGPWDIHPRPFVGVFQKSILDRFVNFWRLFPAKWLQNRPQSQNRPLGYPHEGPSGTYLGPLCGRT